MNNSFHRSWLNNRLLYGQQVCTGQLRSVRRCMRWSSLALLAFTASSGVGCHEASRSPDGQSHLESTPTQAETPEVVPGRVDIDDPNESSRWLFAGQAQDIRAGGWATGNFDAKKNKLVIDTHGIQSFRIDVSRVPIDWNALVVIRIDGKNSELRKRKRDIYQFKRTAQGHWEVAD